MNIINSVQEHLTEEDRPPLKVRWEVCPACRGRGTSTAYLGDVTEWLREDPDAAEDYWGGLYDQACPTCDGRTTVQVVDEESTHPDSLAIYIEWLRDEYETEAIYAMERRMGA